MLSLCKIPFDSHKKIYYKKLNFFYPFFSESFEAAFQVEMEELQNPTEISEASNTEYSSDEESFQGFKDPLEYSEKMPEIATRPVLQKVKLTQKKELVNDEKTTEAKESKENETREDPTLRPSTQETEPNETTTIFEIEGLASSNNDVLSLMGNLMTEIQQDEWNLPFDETEAANLTGGSCAAPDISSAPLQIVSNADPKLLKMMGLVVMKLEELAVKVDSLHTLLGASADTVLDIEGLPASSVEMLRHFDEKLQNTNFKIDVVSYIFVFC